jgi:hypothetical protein
MTARPRGTHVRKAVRLACWNADGVRGRKLELEHFLSEHGIDICLPNETYLEPGRALRFANCLSPDGLPGTAILVRACLGSAAPGGHYHASSVGRQADGSRGGLLITHTTLDRVGLDRVPELGLRRIYGGRPQREESGLEF